MIDKISKLILNKICDKKESTERKEILLFGITRIIEDIPKAIGIIIVGLILNILKEMAIITLIIILYKTFVGGVHSNTNIKCFVYSLAFYLLCTYSSQYITFNNQKYIYIIIFIFSLYIIFTYVPADVPEVPKVNKIVRRKLKVKAIISLVLIFSITNAFVKDIKTVNLILYTMFFIDLMATRTIYKLFKNKYGYETYIPDELI